MLKCEEVVNAVAAAAAATELANKGKHKTGKGRLKNTKGMVSAASAARRFVQGGSENIRELRAAGGISPLVTLLVACGDRSSALSIALSPLLSAIADCCLDDDCRKDISEMNLEPEIIVLLKRSPNDFTVIGRVCRLIGNLVTESSSAEKLNELGILNVLQNILGDNRAPPPTLSMAVRVVRHLWPNCKEDIIKNGTVKSVSDLLCKMEIQISSKMKKDLLTELLKCVRFFTTHSTFGCTQQILGDGTGYQRLVSLVADFKSLPLQCILNLCYVTECRPLLGTAGAIKCLIDLLNEQTDWPASWIKALRLLCFDSVNRLKLQENGGLSLLLSVVKDTKELNRHLYALQTLYSFIYDQYGLIMMANEGFIDIISQLLKDYVYLMKCEHCPHKNDPNTNEDMEVSDNDSGDDENYTFTTGKNSYSSEIDNKDIRNMNWNNLRQRPDLSPYSDSSDGHASVYGNSSIFSPDSIKIYSPSSLSHCDNDSLDSEKSGHYSPVCSDIDEDVEMHNDNDDLLENDELSDSNEDCLIDENLQLRCDGIENSSDEYLHSQRIKYLFIFLYQYSYLPKNDCKLFASYDLLYSIIYYIEKCKRPNNCKAFKTLLKIVSNVTNFKFLLSQAIVIHMHNNIDKPKHSRCKQCKQVHKAFYKLLAQISNLAESEYCVKEISHSLKEDSSGKENLAISIPHIIKSTRHLKKIFVDCNGLELLLDAMSYRSQPLEHCVPALSKLATAFQIRPPKPIFGHFKNYITIKYKPNCKKDNEIIFRLDDSSIVKADKQLLCDNSDVFFAMLQGMFKESFENEVKLQKVSKCGLEYLLNILKYKIQKKQIETFPMPKSLSTALETLLLADRFLIDDVKNLLFSAIIQFRLDSSTADKIYIWSLEDGMGTLCMESVAYILVGQMNNDKKCRIISSILNTIYKDQWIEDVKKTLLRFMT